MFFYWPKRDYLTLSHEFAMITYDPPVSFRGGSIDVPNKGPSSCEWMIPGTYDV